MKKLVKDIAVISLVSGLALFVSGCDTYGPGKYTGGGVMESAVDADVKATLGFNMQALDKNEDGEIETVKGQLQYKDRGANEEFPKGRSFHGVITGGSVKTTMCGNSTGEFEGTYKPQPKGESGTFTVTVFDAGEPGPSEEDSFTIALEGGAYHGYMNSGLLSNGNIKYHPAD